MLDNNFQFLAEYIKSYANESALFNFRPSPGRQTTAWCSTKPTTYITGGNFSGKTHLLLMLACGAGIEHPHDKGWAYWPCMPGDDNLTADMRSKIRLKLPTNVWLSEPSRPMHRDITMGGWGRRDRLGLIEILGSRINPDSVKWSDEAGVWDYVDVEPEGSRLTLKTAQAGPGAYAGPPVDMGLIDEPHNPAIVKEMIARVAKGGGKMTYACTPVVSTTDMDSYKQSWTNILWLKNEVLAKGPSKTVDIITGMAVDENIGYTHDEKERKKEVLMTSGYSKDEQMTRLYGEIRLEGGIPFFDLDVIEYLMQFTREPDIGYLVLEDKNEVYNLQSERSYV